MPRQLGLKCRRRRKKDVDGALEVEAENSTKMEFFRRLEGDLNRKNIED